MNRREFQTRLPVLLFGSGIAFRHLQADTAEKEQSGTDGLKSIGGKWFLKEGQTPLYYYKDGDRALDLFSYHMKDSNGDGIPNVQISHDDDCIIVRSQGYPNHPTAIFPNSNNPNSIEVQDFQFRLPIKPRKSEQITRLPMGPMGMALNGVVFFNPFEQEGMNAVEGYTEVWLDACCGHPQATGIYHYHKYPTCVKSPFVDNGKLHSPLLGFAFDGYPIHGPYESADTMARDLKNENALDVCNGHSDEKRGYHYHVTPGKFPYIIGGYSGVVETSNNRHLRRGQTGAIEDNTQKGSRGSAVITSVTPGNVSRGKTHQIRVEIAPENAIRSAIPDSTPDWVQIGPFKGKSITRDKNIITASFDIPLAATLGVFYDCHIEFGSDDYPVVIKRNDVLRVVN